MDHRPYAISWNLTRRCNQACSHCYLGALRGSDISRELALAECLPIVDDVARANPGALLILTGGEPLLRQDVFDLAHHATDCGLTVVLGTNGVLLREPQARRMRESGMRGASISLDSTDPKRNDAFRCMAGAWRGAVRAAAALRTEGLDFSIHTTVTAWNVDEIPAMIDFARELGARGLNFFFLVRTGRAGRLTDLPAESYDRTLGVLARAQGVGVSTTPPGQTGRLLIRTKCAPFFRRIIYQLDPHSSLLRDYAYGSCPAGKAYCRITPEGDVTPCPYMPLAVGNLRERSFLAIWREAAVFQELRELRLKGRCGACEFSRICGGCRCRAYAATGDYLAEDPACSYQPGQYGGRPITLPPEQTFGLAVTFELPWEEAAKVRMERVPAFARGMVVKAVEAFARAQGSSAVTPEVMQQARARWGMAGQFPSAPRA